MKSREVHRFDPSRRTDFFRLHSEENGCAWCFCTAWWVPAWEGWGDRTAAENRRLREQLFDRGESDGYLLYVNGEPAGWCQAGPRDRLEKLVRQFGLEPDPGVFAVTCFLIAPVFRGQGLAAFLLREIVTDLGKRGARRIEAFPKRGVRLEADDLWNGPEALFRDQGFQVLRDHAERPVFSLDL
jgi:GNAT superfamily N-acetyltransferase